MHDTQTLKVSFRQALKRHSETLELGVNCRRRQINICISCRLCLCLSVCLSVCALLDLTPYLNESGVCRWGAIIVAKPWSNAPFASENINEDLAFRDEWVSQPTDLTFTDAVAVLDATSLLQFNTPPIIDRLGGWSFRQSLGGKTEHLYSIKQLVSWCIVLITS